MKSVLLALLLLAPLALAFDECTTSMTGTGAALGTVSPPPPPPSRLLPPCLYSRRRLLSSSPRCFAGTVGLITCTGNFGKEVNANESWATALAPLADATSVTVELRDVRFNPISAVRALDIVLGVGSGAATGTVAVSLVNCSMKGQEVSGANLVVVLTAVSCLQRMALDPLVRGLHPYKPFRCLQFDYVNSVAMAGTTAYSLKLDGSEVSYNAVNMSGAFFAQADFSLALQVISSSEWMVAAAGGLQARSLGGVITCKNGSQLPVFAASRSRRLLLLRREGPLTHLTLANFPAALAHNRLMALGVAGVGGAGKVSVALSRGSAVLRNDVALVGSLAVGGAASLDVQLASTNVTGNELSGMAHVAVGGQASAAVTGLDDPTVSASRNSVDGLQVDVVLNQPLVPAVLDIYGGLGE
jgi:hypothetical protein